MHDFWCGYFDEKYNNNGQMCYIDTNRFIKNDIEKVFHTSNYKDIEGLLPKEKLKQLLILWRMS